jgi:hypothetical protein
MKKLIVLFSLGLAIILILLGIYIWISKEPQYRFGTDRAAVIKQVQSLSRLETASFSIDKIIEASTDYGQLKQFLFGDKLLLVAHGKVVAGFDLSKTKPEDFKGFGSRISINLPAPEIFSTIIDNSQTQVFDRSTGILSKGELNLEAKARQQAETSIHQAACDGGILDEATKNVKQQLELIFKSSGFTEVTITAPAGTCK